MSTAVMSACWPLQMSPPAKAVLISLADNANDHGYCWPSISTICDRTCLGRTAVMDAIEWLESTGFLVAERAAGRSNRYQIVLNGELFSRTKPVRETDRSAGRTSLLGGLDPSARRTGPVREADPNRKEPSRTVKSDARKNGESKEITFDQWTIALDGHDAIPSDDPIFKWGTEAQIPDEWLELAWLAFADRFTDNRKRYSDWRKAFRNYVKNGWLNIWRSLPDGSFTLTTVGEQFRRVRDAEQSEVA